MGSNGNDTEQQQGTAVVSPAPPSRPWERRQDGNGLVDTGTMPGTGGNYSLQPYQRPYGSLGYGNSTYGGVYGSGYGSPMYGGSGYYGGSMYGGGMFNGGMYGRPYYGGGMYGGVQNPMVPPWNASDPNAPSPPSAWQAMLAAISGVVHFFGRLSFLVDENAHAVHFFISALLQLLDRFGSLYGELARFVLRILGLKREEKNGQRGNRLKSKTRNSQSAETAPFDSLWDEKKGN